MLLKKISKSVACALILGFLGFNSVESAFALEPSDPIQQVSQKILESNLTISQIEDIFQKYLDENNIDLKRGTSEYLNYLYDQMLYAKDENLKNHPDYDLITAYFVEYIIDSQDQMTKPTTRSITNKDKASAQMREVNLKNKDKTAAQIREESIAEDQQLQAEEENLPKVGLRISGYNPNAAKNYAHLWANSHNDNYNYYAGNGGDCTNFVSQCLYNGGLKETKPTREYPEIYATTAYWYSDKPRVTTSWIRVADFHSYWAPKVPDGNYADDTTVSRNGNIGDVVQIRYAGTLKRWHSMIITKKDNNQVYLSGHSVPRYDHPISAINDSQNDWSLLDF